MIAKNLDEVYTNFNPFHPLSEDWEMSEFYVDRDKNPLEKMKRELLRDTKSNTKSLFSGHRGSGKSTELNKLVSDEHIKNEYFVIKYSVVEILDIFGLDSTDLIISIGSQIFIKATEDGKVKIRKELLNQLMKWMGTIEVIKEDISQQGSSIETEAGLSAVFAKLLSRLKIEQTNRENIRQTVKPRLTELVSIINLIIAEAEPQLKKKIIVLIILKNVFKLLFISV